LLLGRGLRRANAAVIPNSALFGRIRHADLARQPAPLGKVAHPGIGVPKHRVIRCHVFRPLPAKRADKLALIGKVVAAVMELHPSRCRDSAT
jgi:hypothetical protein